MTYRHNDKQNGPNPYDSKLQLDNVNNFTSGGGIGMIEGLSTEDRSAALSVQLVRPVLIPRNGMQENAKQEKSLLPLLINQLRACEQHARYSGVLCETSS
jgi:hypothetical protein